MQSTEHTTSAMTGAESLALIESMINKAKSRFSENGHLYLLWGWVVFTCSLAHYLAIRFTEIRHSEYIWFLTWGAVVYMVVYLARNKKKQTVVTYTDELLRVIWVVFVVIMCLLLFILKKLVGHEFYKLLDPIYLTIYGVPTYVSGVLLKFTPLKVGAVLCWGLAILATFIAPADHLLLVSLAMVVAWIIPGYLLKSRYSKQLKENG